MKKTLILIILLFLITSCRSNFVNGDELSVPPIFQDEYNQIKNDQKK